MSKQSDFTGQAVIMHPCPLTLIGLEYLLNQLLPHTSFTCVGSLAAVRSSPTVLHADLIVSTLCDANEKPENSIAWFAWLQQVRKGKPLLILTENENTPVLPMLLNAPGTSLISLREQRDTLLRIITNVLNGQRVISNSNQQQQKTQPPLVSLTAAEQRVYHLLQSGYGVSQIARQLRLSVKTISTHKRRIMAKLNVRTEVELFSRLPACNYHSDTGEQK
ncbi:response regulator transcription factor [Enterobacillus tribolii]|uniref:DNA-binding NarL/FixJ family response regulator n=1 Tax=Enterobacillus tribolii TaxID=1487935 RepID=A0A370QEN1_9GAMM|nr:response regulator transcription factor [Enterobacillus tribolii]MBW7984200.1 response regulator transcription factor [Enterobacillus tribolii]RDK86739.1 DNA-binding NarL/FixJ family response regulator [Enterobacillus tribolii]